MAKIMNWHFFQKKIKEKNMLIFTRHDVARIFNISPVAISFFVFRNTRKGLLIRLKKSRKGSLYCLADQIPNQYLIANKLYEPSYISFDAALSFHNIIPESVYTVTCATTKPTREFMVNNIKFVYYRIKRSVYTEYNPIKYQNTTILMASPEKALTDYLYFVALRKRSLHYDRLDLNRIKKRKFLRLAKLYDKPIMLHLIDDIYANFRKFKRIH